MGMSPSTITGLPLDLDLQPFLPVTLVEGLAGWSLSLRSLSRPHSLPLQYGLPALPHCQSPGRWDEDSALL